MVRRVGLLQAPVPAGARSGLNVDLVSHFSTRPRIQAMVVIDIEYQGGLRTRATHGPSGATLLPDAPVDNHGKGESFSPTDLVATALGTCILTIMGIVAERHGWALEGARASVEKKMRTDGERRIGALEVVLTLPGSFDARQRETLERAALGCPVHRTLGDRVDMPVRFDWNGDG